MAFALLTAPSALAAEPGVTIDPGSPSAKEYALPVDSARRDASGQPAKAVTPGARDAPLFGEGIKPDKRGSGGRVEGSSVGKGDKIADTNRGSIDASAAAPSARLSSSGDDDDAGSTTTLIAGGGGVLLLAILGGLGLRAVRGPERS